MKPDTVAVDLDKLDGLNIELVLSEDIRQQLRDGGSVTLTIAGKTTTPVQQPSPAQAALRRVKA